MSDCLKFQSFTDFEWLVVSPVKPGVDCTWIKDPPKTTKFWPLNTCYNEAIRQSKGELIVSVQDYIWFAPDALHKFWFHYEENKKSCVSGVGDIYSALDEYGKPHIKVWNDPRKSKPASSFYECYPNDWEMNFCSVPKEAMYKIGGCDEYLDAKGYDVVNINVCDRLEAEGYKFYLDITNECWGIKHNEHPKDWNKNLTIFNGEYDKRKKELKEKGLWPVLNYLQKVI